MKQVTVWEDGDVIQSPAYTFVRAGGVWIQINHYTGTIYNNDSYDDSNMAGMLGTNSGHKLLQ